MSERPQYTPLGVGAPRPKHEDRMRQVNQAQAEQTAMQPPGEAEPAPAGGVQ